MLNCGRALLITLLGVLKMKAEMSLSWRKHLIGGQKRSFNAGWKCWIRVGIGVEDLRGGSLGLKNQRIRASHCDLAKDGHRDIAEERTTYGRR